MEIILKNTTAELTIKKSKFIANLIKIENEEDAKNQIKKISKHYFDAKHNCYAYRIYSENKIIEKFSDNGEPSGTAGAPMLDILRGTDLVNALVVVTRYFGGILLGTGGLVKAYSDTTKLALEKAETKPVQIGYEYKTIIKYDDFKTFETTCKTIEITIISTQYNENVEVTFATTPQKLEILKKKIYNLDKIEITKTETFI